MLLSVKEYAEREGKSVQAIYKQIKNKSLKTQETENGIKIIIDELNMQEVERLKSEKEYMKSLAEQALRERERWYTLFNQTNEELKEFKNMVKQIEYKSIENEGLKQEVEGLKIELKIAKEELTKDKSKSWIAKLFNK